MRNAHVQVGSTQNEAWRVYSIAKLTSCNFLVLCLSLKISFGCAIDSFQFRKVMVQFWVYFVFINVILL